MNNSKLVRQVAKVIGLRRAREELKKVEKETDVDYEQSLFCAFVWDNTSQGHPYWRDINRKSGH